MCGAVKQPINLFIVTGTEIVPASHGRQFFGTIPTSSRLRGIISWHSGLVSDSICLSFLSPGAEEQGSTAAWVLSY